MPAQVDSRYIRLRPWKGAVRVFSAACYEGRALLQPGRWLNPFVFGLYRVALIAPIRRPVRAPIFILGTGRSGTTILGTVLSFHREVSYLNEPKALWYMLRRDDDVIGSFGDGPGRYRLDAQDATERVIRNAQRLYGFYLALTRGRRVVDKYPEMIFRVPYLKAIFPDAKFLFLTRNGWDTGVSIERWSSGHGESGPGESFDWWGKDERKWRLLCDQIVAGDNALGPLTEDVRGLESQRDRAVVEWVATMGEGLALLDERPDDVLRVRYEALCANPRETLAEIAAFCGLADDPEWITYGASELKPVPSRAPFPMHGALRPVFDEIMTRLGYDV